MDDNGSDILKITAVHGTQAVCIKLEEPAVFIKEEKEYPSEIEELEEIKHDIRIDLTSIPLVYTTRLDQMNAFNKIGRHTIKEATEMILVESKPRYKQIPEQIKREPLCDSYISNYIKLCSHIQELNTKANIEAYNTFIRNEKLIKMCKPFKIELEDIKSNKIILPSKNLLECIEYSSGEDAPPSYFFEEDIPSSYSSEEDVPLSKSMTYNQFSKAETRKGSFITTIAIKDKRSQEADIYILDTCKGVKSYYRTSMEECDTLQKLHQSKKTVILEYCCWVNREKRITNFVRTGFVRASASIFLRKPHNCLPRPCTCCCVFGPPMPKKTSDVEFIKHSNKTSATEVSVPTNNLIEKACNYKPKALAKVQDMIYKKENEPTVFLKWIVIIFKYQRVIFAQTGLLGENYEIGKNGEIDNHLKPTVNRSIAEEKELYQKYDEANEITRKYYSYLICCWHNREDIIVQLRDSSKLSQSSLRFVRTPHPCRNDKCECCCKPAPFINLSLKNVATQKNTVSSKAQVKVKVPHNNDELDRFLINYRTPITVIIKPHDILVENLQNQDKPKIKKVTNNTAKPRTNNKSTTRIKPRAAQKIRKSVKNTVNLHQQKTVNDSIDLTIESCIEPSPIILRQTMPTQNVQFTDVTSQQTGGNTSNGDSENLTDCTTKPATLLNGILDRFKGLKLAVNENGKLTAMINTPPGQLSTVEIKILSDILSLAATQIAELGITPEEFCNRVNSSRTQNGHTSIPMPELAPISDVPIVNKATINTKNNSLSPEIRASNFPTKSYQNVKKKNTQGCKAQPFNSLFPTTRNRSQACGTYQMMSSLGGLKNQHMVSAYKLHFTEKSVGTDLQPIERLPSKPRKQNMMSPKIAEVYSLADNVTKTTEVVARTPTAKRKKPQEANQRQKKLRIKLPEELSSKNPQHQFQSLRNQRLPSVNQMNVQQTVMETEHNQTPLYISNSNVMPIQNTSGTDVPQPVMRTEHNQTPLYISNNNVLPIQNTNDVVVPGESIMAETPARAQAVNPMLYQMLLQNSPSLRPPALAPLSTRLLAPTTSVRPLILEHSKGPFQKAKRRYVKKSNDAPVTNKKGVQLEDPTKYPLYTDVEMDIETSLKTNVIKMVRPNQELLEDEAIHVVNNITPSNTVSIEPIVIDNDENDEGEGIFGV